MDFTAINQQPVSALWLSQKNISLDVLRLDKIHDVVSGNKWFKLKYYLAEAIAQNKKTIATFGGAWSNHIVATAYACKNAGLNSVGIIRGEKPTQLSHTLQSVLQAGMELHFVSRERYRHKEEIVDAYKQSDWYWINEGGYGKTGAKGAAEILEITNTTTYTHIVAAVGTGTMLAGLINAANPQQKVIGISSMRGNFALNDSILSLLNAKDEPAQFEINHDYHFGGYGKHPVELIDFINESYLQYQLPLDIVYTGKTFYAIKDMVANNRFVEGSRLLMIHSGGLQGNKSLPHKLLAF